MTLRWADIPRAVKYTVHFCGDCPNAHVVFHDTSDWPIAQATLSAQQCEAMAKEIRARDPNFREVKT